MNAQTALGYDIHMCIKNGCKCTKKSSYMNIEWHSLLSKIQCIVLDPHIVPLTHGSMVFGPGLLFCCCWSCRRRTQIKKESVSSSVELLRLEELWRRDFHNMSVHPLTKMWVVLFRKQHFLGVTDWTENENTFQSLKMIWCLWP